MDNNFDFTAMAAKLDALVGESQNALAARGKDELQHMGKINLDEITVTVTGNQIKTWHLCTEADDDGVTDEVIFRVQGVVTKNELVPKSIRGCKEERAVHLSQHIEICGLTSEPFNECVRNMTAVHQKFAQHLAGVQMHNQMPKQGTHGMYMSASNRFFTERSEAPNEQDNNFQPGVDTIGRLAKLKGADLIHAPDNIVKYFRLKGEDGRRGSRYVQTIPGAVKAGDIVELQLTFAAMLSHKLLKISNRLQAVTILDDSFATQAAKLRSSLAVQHQAPIAVRKKTGYFQEDENEVKSKEDDVMT
ncbi:hypothetical protein C8R46DRAFT_1216643 [Mycena filopes]|nr:hypothetical protein C8R46DRAFT_1216643 [Mycena filopes]